MHLPSLPLPPAYRQALFYLICGGTGVFLDFVLYITLIWAEVWYQSANLAGYFAGTCLSFFLNRMLTFQVYDSVLRRLAMFFGVAAVGYSLSTVSLWTLVDKVEVNPVIAKIATLFIVLVCQFSLNKLITFRVAPSPADH